MFRGQATDTLSADLCTPLYYRISTGNLGIVYWLYTIKLNYVQHTLRKELLLQMANHSVLMGVL